MTSELDCEMTRVRVWTETPPGAELWRGVSERVGPSPFDGRPVLFNVADPFLELTLVDSSETVVLILPGGGYHQLSMGTEGREFAAMLVARGVSAAVLAYRLMPTPVDDSECATAVFGAFGNLLDSIAGHYPSIEADACEAVRLLRRGGPGFGAAKRVVAVGFSAGARLVASLAQSEEPDARPDAAAVFYLASLVQEPVSVPAGAPPLFVLAAADDPLGISGNETLHQAWRAAGRPAEYHLFERGSHGFGTKRQGLPVDGWPELLFAWLSSHGLV